MKTSLFRSSSPPSPSSPSSFPSFPLSLFLFLSLSLFLFLSPSSAQSPLTRPICSSHLHEKTYFLDNFSPFSINGIIVPTWAVVDVIFRKSDVLSQNNETLEFAVVRTAAPSSEISALTEVRFVLDQGPYQNFLEVYHSSAVNSTLNNTWPTLEPTSPQTDNIPKDLESSGTFLLPSKALSLSSFFVSLALGVMARGMTQITGAFWVGVGALVAGGMAQDEGNSTEVVLENCTVSITLEIHVRPGHYEEIFQSLQEKSWVIQNAASVSFVDELDPALVNQTTPSFPPSSGALLAPSCLFSSPSPSACVDSSICSLIQGTVVSPPDNSSSPCLIERETLVCCSRDDYVIDFSTIIGPVCNGEHSQAGNGGSACVAEEVCEIAGGIWEFNLCNEQRHICCAGNGVHVVNIPAAIPTRIV